MLKTTVQRKIDGAGALGHYTATAVQHKIYLQKWLQDIFVCGSIFRGFKSSGMWHCVTGWVAANVLFFSDYLTYEDEQTKTSKLILPVTWCHIPQSSATWKRIPNIRKRINATVRDMHNFFLPIKSRNYLCYYNSSLSTNLYTFSMPHNVNKDTNC
jgi:hypothetical protein